MNRWQETERDLSTVLGETAESWQERGWDVSQQGNQAHPDIRITATTDSGYWFAVEEDQANQRVVLRGQSPVYWGPLDETQCAIVERAAVEEAAGQTWQSGDRDDETGQAIRQPGKYRPFSGWDA